MIKIELIFGKADTRLAGFPYGKKIYEEQVKQHINYNALEEIVIVFPKQIEMVASSFVQGLFAELKKNIGLLGIERYVTVQAATDELVKIIVANIH